MADEGTYPLTFTATGSSGVAPVTTGTLTLTVANAAATACSAPASGGTSTTFTVGTASSYSVACYGTAGASYPPSITIASGTLPADAAFPTTVGQGCAQSTSGTGAATEYILTCKITETPTATDEGTYPLTFTATGAGGPPSHLGHPDPQGGPDRTHLGQRPVHQRHQERALLRRRGRLQRRRPPA